MAHADAADHHDDEQHIAHVTPLKVYFGVWAALIVGTIITVAVSYVDFNAMLGIQNVNLLVAMIVASIKAGLVCAFFMHLKQDNKIFALTFLSSIAFLGIFFILTFADLMTRGNVDPQQGTFEKNHRAQKAVAPSATPAAHH